MKQSQYGLVGEFINLGINQRNWFTNRLSMTRLKNLSKASAYYQLLVHVRLSFRFPLEALVQGSCQQLVVAVVFFVVLIARPLALRGVRKVNVPPPIAAFFLPSTGGGVTFPCPEPVAAPPGSNV